MSTNIMLSVFGVSLLLHFCVVLSLGIRPSFHVSLIPRLQYYN